MRVPTNGEGSKLDREKIDLIVEKARQSLAPYYRQASTPKFPFGIHHNCARYLLREPVTRRYLKKTEIAALLVAWAHENGGAEVYAWQSIALATQQMASDQQTIASDKVLSEAKSVLHRVIPFVDWMKARMAAAREKRRDQSQEAFPS